MQEYIRLTACSLTQRHRDVRVLLGAEAALTESHTLGDSKTYCSHGSQQQIRFQIYQLVDVYSVDLDLDNLEPFGLTTLYQIGSLPRYKKARHGQVDLYICTVTW
jgi:hypothetical protein